MQHGSSSLREAATRLAECGLDAFLAQTLSFEEMVAALSRPDVVRATEACVDRALHKAQLMGGDDAGREAARCDYRAVLSAHLLMYFPGRFFAADDEAGDGQRVLRTAAAAASLVLALRELAGTAKEGARYGHLVLPFRDRLVAFTALFQEWSLRRKARAVARLCAALDGLYAAAVPEGGRAALSERIVLARARLAREAGPEALVRYDQRRYVAHLLDRLHGLYAARDATPGPAAEREIAAARCALADFAGPVELVRY